MTNSKYSDCLSTTFSICKNPCLYEDLTVSEEEYRALIRWLNRRQFLSFAFLPLDANEDKCYYDASFNVSQIQLSGQLYGLELTMTTNRPYGYGETEVVIWNITDPDTTLIKFVDNSDELGYLYPDLQIVCRQAGDLDLWNRTENIHMIIKNCSLNEQITIYGTEQIINTSDINHSIWNDFNFNFFRIGNSSTNRVNEIICSLPCEITMNYIPIRKGIL